MDTSSGLTARSGFAYRLAVIDVAVRTTVDGVALPADVGRFGAIRIPAAELVIGLLLLDAEPIVEMELLVATCERAALLEGCIAFGTDVAVHRAPSLRR
jgi:hypothetical protein